MSTVLHPVGPEPPQTYWARRVAVLGVAIVVIAVAVALILNGTSSGSALTASPAPVTPPAATPASADTAAPTASAKATATATATGSRSPRATQSTTSAKRSAKPTKTPKPAPVACPASELRPTLTGKQQLKVKRANKFRLSLINGSGQTCVALVTSKNFELKIYSGTDRIWSTRDCARAVKAVKKKLAPEQALAWSMRWNGRRSRDDCKNRPELPRPGTYFATAQLDGAKPVQLRMIIA